MLLSRITAFLISSLAQREATQAHTGDNAHARNLLEFRPGSWIENIAVRANGNLLLTRLDVPEIYELDPHSRHRSLTLVATAPKATSVFGIDEISPDVFAFAAGNFSFVAGSTRNSWAVHKLDLTQERPRLSKIADIPTAEGPLNGLTALPATRDPHDILTSDIAAGLIYRISPSTGAVNVAVDNRVTAAVEFIPGSKSGVNGIHINPKRTQMLYLANTGQHIFADVPIDSETSTPEGKSRTMANVKEPKTVFNFDDFALPHDLERDNAAYVVTGSGNSVERISLVDGLREVVAGNLNSTLVAGPTSAAFGRLAKDQKVLYVVTSGAQLMPVNGEEIVGAQVVAVDVGKWRHKRGGGYWKK